MRVSVRTVLALDVAAVACVMAMATLVMGLPAAARHGLTPALLVVAVVASAGLAAIAGTLLLWRAVARPVDRMLDAAQDVGRVGGLPVLGEGEEAGLSRTSVLFGRVVRELADERGRLAAKVEELTRADRALGNARDHLDRAERLATMGRLAAGLAHEIGNPLGAVCGYVELARARLPAGAAPDLVEALDRVADAAARIDRILRELLDFARPTPPRTGPVLVGPLVDTALRLARVQPRFRGVEVELALPPGLPAVRGEEHRLAQVLLNLLLNAGDAMAGAGRVEVSAQETDGGVEIAVTDGGPGISTETLPHLFEPFFTTKRPGEGTGLGLATSQRIVEELGGTLTAANGAARGAVFRIRLLRAVPEPSASPAAGA